MFKVMYLVLLVYCASTGAKDSKGVVDLFNIETPYQSIPMTDVDVSLKLDIRLKWKAWLLMNQPVIYSEAVWNIKSLRVKSATGVRDFSSCSEGASSCIPESVLKQVKLLDYSFLLPIYPSSTRSNIGALKLDPGVYGVPDTHSHYESVGLERRFQSEVSYNTPGSPSWYKTIITNDHLIGERGLHQQKSQKFSFLSADDARAVFLAGFDLSHSKLKPVTPVSFSISYFALSDYFLNQQENTLREKVEQETISQIESATNTVDYEEEDDFLADFEKEYVKEEAIKELTPKVKNIEAKIKSNRQELTELKNDEARQLAFRIKSINSHHLPGQAITPAYDQKTKLYGYKKTKDDELWLIEPTFTSAGEFSEGVAAVALQKTDTSWGYINYQADWVIKPSFFKAHAFNLGKAEVAFDYHREMGKCDRVKREYWKTVEINLAGEQISVPSLQKKYYKNADGDSDGRCSGSGFHLTLDPIRN
jgi:hypothetical protein